MSSPGEITNTADSTDARFCPHCQYDLRMLETTTCPECGGAVDEASTRQAQIPWQNRHRIGWVRSFLQTVWLATFKTRQFSQAVSQPIDYASALLFRRIVIAILLLAMLSATGIVFHPEKIAHEIFMPLYELSDLIMMLLPTWTMAIVLFTLLVGAWLFLEGLTGLHTYWFHPSHLDARLQKRSLAISHYACAPLLFLCVCVIGLLAGFFLWFVGLEASMPAMIGYANIILIASGLCGVLFVAAFWRICLVMVRRSAHRGLAGAMSLFLLQPLLIFFWAVLTMALLPGLIAYICMMLDTMS